MRTAIWDADGTSANRLVCIDSREPIAYLRAMIRPIIALPDPRLRKPSAPVERVDTELRALVQDMFETMYEAPGVGLAAVQVGVPKRVIVADPTRGEEAKKPIAMINPEVIWSSEEREVQEEGCLSIPEVTEEVERPLRVKVRYLDLEGEAREAEADGLFARVLQHEIDHINGILFIDHISRLKRSRIIRKFAKAAKREAAG
jgi:peptide deformylase